MPKIRIVYIISIVMLGVLLTFTVLRPMVSREKYSEVSRKSVIQSEDEWIIEVDIINSEGKDTDYIINWSVGGETYSERVSIKDGQVFTHIHHFYPETVKEGKVHLTIHKEDEATPFEEGTYYIRFD